MYCNSQHVRMCPAGTFHHRGVHRPLDSMASQSRTWRGGPEELQAIWFCWHFITRKLCARIFPPYKDGFLALLLKRFTHDSIKNMYIFLFLLRTVHWNPSLLEVHRLMVCPLACMHEASSLCIIKIVL